MSDPYAHPLDRAGVAVAGGGAGALVQAALDRWEPALGIAAIVLGVGIVVAVRRRHR